MLKYVDVSQVERQERLFGEKETLGLYLSGHPIHRYLKELSQLHYLDVLLKLRPAQKTVILSGIITSLRVIQTKRGDRMAVVTIEDGIGPN